MNKAKGAFLGLLLLLFAAAMNHPTALRLSVADQTGRSDIAPTLQASSSPQKLWAQSCLSAKRDRRGIQSKGLHSVLRNRRTDA